MKLTKAVLYARYSSSSQRTESIDAQVRAIEKYAKENNIIILHKYLDEALSGTSDERPEFLQMIKDSKEGEFELVLVHKLDRFARNKYDSTINTEKLRRNGVRLFSVTERIDNESPEGKMFSSMLEGMNEFYSENLARETMKGLKENAYQCKHTGGSPPLGYDVDPETKLLVINEREAEAVRYIFSNIVDGVGYKTIADELNRMGYQSKRGGKFSTNTISTMIKNEKYIGNFVFNRSASRDARGIRNGSRYKDRSEWIIIEDGCPAIISKEDFEFVQAKRKANVKRFIGYKRIETYLLTGKIVCGICGGKYIGERRHDKRADKLYIKYGCNIKKRQGTTACTSRQVDRDILEQLVLKLMAEEVFHPKMKERMVGYYHQYCDNIDSQQEQEIQRQQRKISTLKRDIETVINMITKTQSEALLGRLSALEDQLKKAEKELQTLERIEEDKRVSKETIYYAFDKAKELFAKGELSDMQNLIDTFLEKIEVYDDEIYIQYTFDSSRTMPVALSLKEKAQEKDVGNSPRPFIIQKNLRADFATRRNGGERGIRTPESY